MIKKPSPLMQMTIALTMLCASLVIMADIVFGLGNTRDDESRLARQRIGETIAIQIVDMLQDRDKVAINRVLKSLVTQGEHLRSISLRTADSVLTADSGAHRNLWVAPQSTQLGPDQMIVRLVRNDSREVNNWGQVEILFTEEASGWWPGSALDPTMLIVLFIMFIGGPAFYLYLRRALLHLDPASVIPERVQSAFDTMSDGVVIVDTDGHILMASRAFKEMNPLVQPIAPGMVLSTLRWLAPSLPEDIDEHPWMQAIVKNRGSMGHSLVVPGKEEELHLLVGCSPIAEPGMAARGCLVTFSDVTELHRTNSMLRTSNEALSAATDEVQRQNESLRQLATRDPMTGCLNRRALFDGFERLIARSARDNKPISCFMVDIDHFKQVNDTHGHGVGDRVIEEVGRELMDLTRSTDLVARYGGEEFCLVFPGLPAEAANGLAERIRARIEKECGHAITEVDGLKITASLGVTTVSGARLVVQTVIDQADQALYEAKRGGRNQVKVLAAGPHAVQAKPEAQDSDAQDSEAQDPEDATSRASGATEHE